jgi:hypothetical protein
MPITYNDTTKTITAQWVSGDAKGGTSANPWVIGDFSDAMAAAGHGDKWVVSNRYHAVQIRVLITGVNTYVQWVSAVVDWVAGQTLAVRSQILSVTNSANFICGRDFGGAVRFFALIVSRTDQLRFWFDAFVKIYNTSFFWSGSTATSYEIHARGYAADPTIFDGVLAVRSRYFCRAIGANLDNIVIRNSVYNESLYGLIFQQHIPYMENVYVEGLVGDTFGVIGTRQIVGVIAPLGSLTVRPDQGTSIDQLVDCILPTITFLSPPACVVGSIATAEYLTTLAFTVIDGAGATARIYDKDDNLLHTETLDGSGALIRTVKYKQTGRIVVSVSPTVLGSLDATYQPLRVIINRAGYETIEIGSITVTEGQPTRIRAELKTAIEAMVTNKGIAIKANKENYGNDRDFAIIP